MIVKEYYPFIIVEDVEFIKLVNMLNPGYSLPSRKTLSTSLLPVLYNEIYKKVQSDIEVNAQYVALTTDAWTSLKNESYTAITVHFIDQNCELKSYLLSCAKFSMRHTSENIKDCLQNIVRQWGLQNKIAACTTDNASNITSAICLCQWRHVSCFAIALILLFNLLWTKSKKLELKLKALSSTLKEVHSPLKN